MLNSDNDKDNALQGFFLGLFWSSGVARRITGSVREVDTVSRLGRDEFVVLLSELDIDKAKSVAEAGIVAEKIRVALAEPFLRPQQQGRAECTVTHHCTSSIGVVIFINNEISPDHTLKRADHAMYQAKDAGRNAVRFFDLPSPMKSG